MTDGDLAAAFPIHKVSKVEKSKIDLNGQSQVQYSFDLNLKSDAAIHSHAIVRVDRSSRRILLWEETHAGGMHILTKFDFPASGPRDIYELGAASDATVIDRVASSDVVELAERFQQEVYDFGNYEALVIDWLQSDDSISSGQPLLRRLWRSGKKFRVELLTSIEPNFRIPADVDRSWWRAYKTQFAATPLADCDGETCMLFTVDDPRLEIANEISPRVYWLSFDHDHAVIKSSLIQPDFAGTAIGPVEKHVHYEYSNYDKSPDGITFAARRIVSESNGTRTRMTRYVVDFDVAK